MCALLGRLNGVALESPYGYVASPSDAELLLLLGSPQTALPTTASATVRPLLPLFLPPTEEQAAQCRKRRRLEPGGSSGSEDSVDGSFRGVDGRFRGVDGRFHAQGGPAGFWGEAHAFPDGVVGGIAMSAPAATGGAATALPAVHDGSLPPRDTQGDEDVVPSPKKRASTKTMRAATASPPSAPGRRRSGAAASSETSDPAKVRAAAAMVLQNRLLGGILWL